MKKSLIALAVLGSMVGVASAQSSVTLFGIVDANLSSVKTGSASKQILGTDGLSSSRLGFKGEEDLGGGLKAGFWLEHRLQPDSGTLSSSRFWHGRASVSLMGEFGEVRLGRFLTDSFMGITSYDIFGTNGMGQNLPLFSTLGSGAQTLVRADNTVAYFLPAMGGLYGSVSVAAGEGTDANKYTGGRLGYGAGPIDVSVSMSQTGTTNKYKLSTVGGSYDAGVAKLFLSFSNTKYLDRKQTISTIGATVPVGTGTFRIQFAKSNANAAAEAITGDAKLFGLGYVHPLSKRTTLYADYGRISNEGKATFVVSGAPGAAAGQDSTGYSVGVRHSF